MKPLMTKSPIRVASNRPSKPAQLRILGLALLAPVTRSEIPGPRSGQLEEAWRSISIRVPKLRKNTHNARVDAEGPRTVYAIVYSFPSNSFLSF